MNYRYHILGVALSALIGTASAQTYLGYSDGTRGAGYSFGSTSQQGLALCLSSAKASYLKGAKITGISTLFRTLQVRDLTAFVAKDLDGDVLLSEPMGKALNSWTDYNFSTPVEVTGEELAVGYTLEMASSISKPLAFDGSGDFREGIFYALQDGEWRDASLVGLGAANIRLIVEGAPEVADLTMKALDGTGVFKTGKAYHFKGSVYNFGTKALKGLRFTVSVGDDEPVEFTRNVTVEPGATYEYTTPAYTINTGGAKQLKVSVVPADEGDSDADLTDNEASVEIRVLDGDIKKKVLIEGFTTQACGNCVDGHEALHKAISQSAEDFIIINHHAGFGTDRFTTLDDYQMTWYYGEGGTFAPAAMFNRLPIIDDEPVFPITNEAYNLEAVRKTLATDPPVQLAMTNTFDPETGKGNVSIDVETLAEFSNAEHRITVSFTQDGLKAFQMDYTNGNQAAYEHNDVYRFSISSYMGDPIELKVGETTTVNYPYTIPAIITSTYGSKDYGSIDIETDPEKMHIVAFVHDYTEGNYKGCPVYNAASLPVYVDPAGINTPATERTAVQFNVSGERVSVAGSFRSLSIYTPAGKLVRTVRPSEGSFMLPSGLYVVSVKGLDGRLTSRKLSIR